MKLTKEILKEEIDKTQDTIKSIGEIQKKNIEQSKQINKDCEVGLKVNQFVLDKLEEEWKRMS